MSDATVIDMAARRGMRGFKACAQIDAYWEALRGTRPMPTRDEIAPRAIEDALHAAFILDVLAPGVARIRVAGLHLNELLNMEVRGMPISAFMTAASRETFAEALKSTIETPAKTTLTLKRTSGFGRPELTARMIMLPIQSDGGQANRILGALETLGPIGKTPCRFDMEHVENSPIRTVQLAPPAKEMTLPPAAPPKRSYLRLVSDNS